MMSKFSPPISAWIVVNHYLSQQIHAVSVTACLDSNKNQVDQYTTSVLFRLVSYCFKPALRVLWRLVEIINPSKAFYFTFTGFGVYTLYVARFAFLYWSVDKDFDKAILCSSLHKI